MYCEVQINEFPRRRNAVKVNVDASVGEGWVGMGVVARGGNGEVLYMGCYMSYSCMVGA